jgi:hypothetical protein
MHGFGCWFDVTFLGTTAVIELSTAPDKPTTHWYQVFDIKDHIETEYIVSFVLTNLILFFLHHLILSADFFSRTLWL